MGGTIEELVPERGYFYVNLRGKRILVTRKFKIASNLIVGGETARYKDLTYVLLKEKGLPMPKTICIYEFEKKGLGRKLKSLNYPIIIKDAKGSNSKGIFANIKNAKTATDIAKKAIKKFPQLVIQEMVRGKEFRLLMLGGKLIGALELIPPRVFGDGVHTVNELIKEKQKHTEKQTPRNILFNQYLKEQGYSVNSIPQKGAEIYLRKSSSLAEGGETKDVTALVSKKIETIGAQTAETLKKTLAGIDVICEDISKDPDKQSFNILEVNGKPDIYIHYNPTYGQTQDVVRKILEYILKLENIG